MGGWDKIYEDKESQNLDPLSLHSCFLGAFRMLRIDPSRQVSMSAARAGSPAFTEGQNIKEGDPNLNVWGKFGEGGGGEVQKIYKKTKKNLIYIPYIFPIYF